MPSCDNKERYDTFFFEYLGKPLVIRTSNLIYFFISDRTKYFGTEDWVRGIEEVGKHIRSFDNKPKRQNRKNCSINDSIASLSMTIFLVLPLLIQGLAEASGIKSFQIYIMVAILKYIFAIFLLWYNVNTFKLFSLL